MKKSRYRCNAGYRDFFDYKLPLFIDDRGNFQSQMVAQGNVEGKLSIEI